ncbi:nucleoside recognition domain-containing protein [Bernardetia sp. Wsw4-3y2]|uniref:nucleoside recognition domain-containing protein n=1 Tax=Bernardetia sp. Wsw4-3y2 TaxID=3127471 RepID=UPI0030D5DCA4
MALNRIWIGFFLIAFIFAIFQLFNGDIEVFSKITNSTFESAKTGFEISLYLTGAMALWLGIMKIGEQAGAIEVLAKLVSPLFKHLFPEVPKNHDAVGAMLMNFSANMLGLDNAATPLGLKAMEELQSLNPKPETASNAQIMFLVLNTSGLTIIPVSVMVYRAQAGAVNPAEIFVPILIATFFATLAGILAVGIKQKLNLLHPVVIAYLGGLTAFISIITWFFSTLPQEKISLYSSVASNFILFGVMVSFIAWAAFKKVNVYETFIEGAKEGFSIAIKVIPYLVAMLVAIGVFRASGAMDMLISAVSWFISLFGFDTQFVKALPVAIMKPLSGSGARGLMIDAFTTYGVDSFVGKVAATLQGSTDTTFYVLAVYFGAVNIKNTRYAVSCGLIADGVGIIAAILLSYLFFA